MLSRDGWGGLVVTAASLLLFWMTLDLKDSPLVPIGPGFYPRIVLGITAALGLWMLVGDFLGRGKRVAAPPAAPANYAAVALHFAVFGLYVGALPNLGFRLSTFLYVAVANALMDPPRGARGWTRVLALALVTAAVVYMVFERYLSVLMPRGRWTGF
ncbi:MAG: tripartite tricarboxylate transporter TctB family protein [Betaproteobacteria bacterium]|nr:tripartite tricarboxylate transporter TctB family protein [Betaproteobacteria bacterium]